MPRVIIRPFPTLDSLLLAAAVFAVSGCLVFLLGGEKANPRFYAMVLAGLGLVLLLYLGRRRGRNNLDGVFIGPVLRTSALVILVAAGGLWLSLWLATPAADQVCADCDDPVLKRRSEDCRRRLERVENMLSALKELAGGGRDGLADSADFRAKFNSVDGSDYLLADCGGSEIDDHVRRRDALIEELREYYEKPTQQPLANIADAITKNPAKTADPEKPPYAVETEPRGIQDALPKVYVVFDDPIQSAPPGAGSPGNGGSGTENPSSTRRRVEYRAEFRPDLLKILLGGFGFGWGAVKITVEEVEGAVEEVKKQNSGQPLEDLFDKKSLTQTERNAFIQKLVELGLLEEATGSEWSKSIRIYLSQRLGMALCMAISRDIGLSRMPSEGTDLNELLTRRVGRSPQDRIEIDAEVRSCLEGLAGDRTPRALDRYQKLVNASGG